MRCRYDWCLHRIIPLDQLILRYYRLYAWSNVVFLNKISIICKLNRDSFSHFFWPNPSNFTPKAAFSLSLICKIFSCYPVGMWLLANLEKKLHFVLNINVGTRAIKKVTHITWEFCTPKALVHCEWLTLIRSTFPIMRVTLTPDSAVHDICILILGYTRFLRLLNGSFRFFLSW